MHMRKLLLLSLMLMLIGVQLFAQQRTVTGTVTDDKKTPLPNVSVTAKGTNVGTITKDDGSYSLTVPASARTLVFSFTDMGTQEIAIGNNSVVDATLSMTTRSMDEVIVVGYGTQRRRDVT